MVYIIDPQNAGISGNMIIGALVDLGADGEKVKNLMEDVAVDFGEVEVSLNKVNKSGIDATFCNVKTIDEDNENNHHVHFPDFMEKIDLLKYADIENLTDEMVEMAKKVFKRIAISESRVHGKSLEEVHFHEVGAADAVADVLGSICAYFDLGMDKDKVKDFSKGEAKCVGGPVNSELATPTGCALYMEFCDEFLEFAPMMSPEEIAYGCGSKEFDFPNVLRIIKSKNANGKHKVSVIETNIDHMSGEELGFLFDLLLIEGASDVSMVPITMKKNRPGHLIKIISKPDLVDHLVNILFKETGTLGIRVSENTHRGVAERQFVPLDINVGNHIYTINFKIGLIGDEIISHRPEYEDLRRISVEQDIPLIEIRDVANTMIRDYLENNRE